MGPHTAHPRGSAEQSPEEMPPPPPLHSPTPTQGGGTDKSLSYSQEITSAGEGAETPRWNTVWWFLRKSPHNCPMTPTVPHMVTTPNPENGTHHCARTL